ncbi:MAG: methyltransferase domain-containing protein, partial [Chloroflexota bacterium]|nr:methyltransferase domain-containing protein [Chloroflexota bacterium]
PHVGHVTVTDLTPQMLDQAQAHLSGKGVANADYWLADAEDLPFPDGGFDLVTCRIAPHHFAEVERFVAEVARVLRPGGLFLLIDSVVPEDAELDAFVNTLEARRDPSHVRSHTLAEWREFVAGAGLRLTHEEVGRKAVTFAPWAARTQMPAEAAAALEADMLAAPAEAQAHFAITRDADGRLQSWTMEYALFRAEREE